MTNLGLHTCSENPGSKMDRNDGFSEQGVCAQTSKGSIVNVSSIAGQRPVRGAAAYCVSKAAVDMLTKASALELAPKVSLVVPLGT